MIIYDVNIHCTLISSDGGDGDVGEGDGDGDNDGNVSG